MEGMLFFKEELEHRINEMGEVPPVGTQWWEMPTHLIPASVVDNGNGTVTVNILKTEAEFNERPLGARLVAFRKDAVDSLKPKKRPVAVRVKAAKKVYRGYRNLAAIFS